MSTYDQIKRTAEKNGWISHLESESSSCAWLCPPLSGIEQIEAYFCEACALALSSADPLLALRATLQAHEYLGRLMSANRTNPLYHDWSRECRNRCEDLLRGKVSL